MDWLELLKGRIAYTFWSRTHQWGEKISAVVCTLGFLLGLIGSAVEWDVVSMVAIGIGGAGALVFLAFLIVAWHKSAAAVVTKVIEDKESDIVDLKEDLRKEKKRKSEARKAFERDLAKCEMKGRGLLNCKDRKIAANWIDQAYGIVQRALGEAEANLLISSSGYIFLGGTEIHNLVDGRLRRIASIIERLAILEVQPDYEPEEWV